MSIPDPVVLLDARARYVNPTLSLSRASAKAAWDAHGRLVTVPANALGWDFDPATGESRGLFTEPQSTNLILHSNDLSDGAWSLNNSPAVTPNAIVGPDGAGMARVERTASGATSIFQVPTIVAGEPVCGSLIAKAGELTAIEVRVGPGSGHMRYAVSLIDGSAVLPPTTGGSNASEVEIVDYGVEDLGDGFWRPWIAGTLASGTTSATTHALLWAGGVGDGVYVGYVQTEPRSYVSSYIETGGATATRAADTVQESLGGLPWWRNDAGTFVWEVEIPTFRTGYLFSLSGLVCVRGAPSGDPGLILFGDAVGGTYTVLPGADVVGRHVFGFTWDNDADWALAVDGALRRSEPVTAPIPSSPTLGLGSRLASAATVYPSHWRRLAFYPQRISNADLQSLTAIQE